MYHSKIINRLSRFGYVKISKDHPRYRSLTNRELLAELVDRNVVSTAGLIAHGRGEAFDYLIGERTTPEAERAERVAAAHLLEAANPVISINGNAAALSAVQIIKLAEVIPAKMEVNLFHRTEERIDRVCSYMEEKGATGVLGKDPDATLEGIASDRSLCTSEGIFSADVVLVPLEDGDRAEALVQAGKTVIAVDLNPLSRTSLTSTVTIVDELTRSLPNIERFVLELRDREEQRKQLISEFDNLSNLESLVETMCADLVENFSQKC